MRSRLWPAYKRILQHSTLPILCGPFRGEVGFEVLYWIPFLKRFAKRYNIDPARLIPVTRGGMGALYGFGDPIELYSLCSPQDVRVENRIQHAKYQMLKQMRVIPFDREMLAKAVPSGRYLTLHPSWMFTRLERYFASKMSLHELEQECLFEPLMAPALPAGVTLPEKFIAVRFYLRHTFPGHPQLIQFATESVKTMAQTTPVVLLHSGVHADDHQDIGIKTFPHHGAVRDVVKLTDLCEVTPQNNLAIQAAVLARALGFVGTYGGLAQMALRIGKPSVSYYAEWGGTAMAHKHLADAIALQAGIPCQVHKVGELPLLQSVVPAMQLVV